MVKKAVPAKKTATGKKSVPAKVTDSDSTPAKTTSSAKAPVKKAAAKKVVTKKVAAKKTAPSPVAATKPSELREPRIVWTPAELADIKAQLIEEVGRLEEEIVNAEAGLVALIQDSGDGAGDDQADAGSKTFEREHEMSLANNARDMLQQVHHAMDRIDDGTYGECESCEQSIGKNRLQAFPRATLCLACKQVEERY